MNHLYKKGDLIQIKTKCDEVIEGQFYAMSDDNTRISLCDTKEVYKNKTRISHCDTEEASKDKPSDGILHYYEPEIHDIIRLKVSNQQQYIKLAQKDFEEAILVSKKYIYVNQVDNIYHAAMYDLKDQSYVGLSTDGASMGRKCKMPFLVLSTPKQIYIFDTQVMQYHAFDAGLKELLESEFPKKIVHDSRSLSDCLKHKHNVNLHSVFDTQVGDVIIMRNKNGVLPKDVKSLSDCIHTYLGLPQNIINDKHDIIQSTERPLSSKIKESLAKNIAFLHQLSEAIHEEMQLPFLRGVQCYIESLRSCDDLKAWALSSKLNQIPQEFKSATDY